MYKATRVFSISDDKNDLKQSIEDIKEAVEDHLISINENTNEIESNYELICSLNDKMDKISERLEKIELFLHEKADFFIEEKPNFDIKPLTKREQEVFLVLYTLDESKNSITYLDITKRTGLTEDLVSNYITRMIEKGVPILKKYINGKAHLKLNRQFKQLQAKENILNIEQRTIF
jgi:hypothetical protein